MNYYNPYFSGISYTPSLGNIASTSTSRGLLSSLFGGGKLSSFINGTQKTLNIINQAIPIVKQMSPVMKNAKTMFRVMNEFKKVDSPRSYRDNINNTANSMKTNTENNIFNESIEEIPNLSVQTNGNGPTFFL